MTDNPPTSPPPSPETTTLPEQPHTPPPEQAPLKQDELLHLLTSAVPYKDITAYLRTHPSATLQDLSRNLTFPDDYTPVPQDGAPTTYYAPIQAIHYLHRQGVILESHPGRYTLSHHAYRTLQHHEPTNPSSTPPTPS